MMRATARRTHHPVLPGCHTKVSPPRCYWRSAVAFLLGTKPTGTRVTSFIDATSTTETSLVTGLATYAVLPSGVKRHPSRALAAEFRASEELQVRQRVPIQVVVQPAAHDQRPAIRGHRHAVRRIGTFRHGHLSGRKIGILHPPDFLARGEVHDRETVEAGQLREDPFRRSVRVRVERHRTDAEVHLQRPRRLLGCGVDHVDGLTGDRAGDDEFAVRRDVGVVNRALGGHCLHALHGRRVDDVDAAWLLDDPHVDVASVLADRHVVRVAAQRNLLHDGEGLRVDHVERALGLVADVDAAAIR